MNVTEYSSDEERFDSRFSQSRLCSLYAEYDLQKQL